jgi:hypothetical protein
MLQVEAANAYARADAITNRLYITEQTSNILKLRTKAIAAAIFADTRTLMKGRYLRRWARRLQTFSFSSEDAVVLSYGSFGIDIELGTVGVDAIITCDIKLAENFTKRNVEIEERFASMVLSLPQEYKVLRLPQVMTTSTVLAFL